MYKENKHKLLSLLCDIGFEKDKSVWDECYVFTDKKGIQYEFIIETWSATHQKNVRLMILIDNCWHSVFRIIDDIMCDTFKWNNLFDKLETHFKSEIRKTKIDNILLIYKK